MYIKVSRGFSTGSLFRKLLIKPAVNPSTHFLGDITSLCRCKMYSILIRWDGWDTSIEDWGAAKTPENDIQGSLHEKRQKSCVKLYLIHSSVGSGLKKEQRTMLQRLSKCEVKAWLCWNLIILSPLRFYVKSNFGDFKQSKNVIFGNFRDSEHRILVNFGLESC